jgi:hypothetical protein
MSTGIVGLRLILVSLFLFVITGPTAHAKDRPTWGVTYSPSQAVYLGLDPKQTYQAIIKDLGVKHIKLHINWNAIEPQNNQYNFADLDYYVRHARKNNVELIMVIGMKTGRWPECHTPEWVHTITPENRDDEILAYVQTLVERYQRVKAIAYWQIENEPFLKFGTCPDWYYDLGTTLVTAAVALVKKLDPTREIIVSESGELSDWTQAAQVADIVGITMYRNAWDSGIKTFGPHAYAFRSPRYYQAKADHIEKTYQKPVINIELQAEPWASKPIMEASLAEQALSMNPKFFRESIEFASQAGLSSYYFWGVEWWYWMKTTHNQPTIWNRAKPLFRDSR